MKSRSSIASICV